MQRNSQQLANIETNQQATHSTLHQIIARLNAVTFNASDAGRGTHAFQAHGFQHSCGRELAPGGGGRGRGFPGRGGPPMYIGGTFPSLPTTQGRGIMPPAPQGGGFPPGFGGQHSGPARPPAFAPSTFAPQGGTNGGRQGPQVQQQPFSNVTKHSTRADLTLRMDTQACLALRICVRLRMTFILTAKMLSSISIWAILAPPGTDTRRSFPACDG